MGLVERWHTLRLIGGCLHLLGWSRACLCLRVNLLGHQESGLQLIDRVSRARGVVICLLLLLVLFHVNLQGLMVHLQLLNLLIAEPVALRLQNLLHLIRHLLLIAEAELS